MDLPRPHWAELAVATHSPFHRNDHLTESVVFSAKPGNRFSGQAAQGRYPPVRPFRVACQHPECGPSPVTDAERQTVLDVPTHGLDKCLVSRTDESHGGDTGVAQAPCGLHPVSPIDHQKFVSPHDDWRPMLEGFHQHSKVAFVQTTAANPLPGMQDLDRQRLSPRRSICSSAWVQCQRHSHSPLYF